MEESPYIFCGPKIAGELNTVLCGHSILEASAIDAILLDLVADDAFRRAQHSGSFGAVAAGGLEGVLYEVLFVGLDSLGERRAHHRTLGFGCLKARGQMVTVDAVAVTNTSCSLYCVFQLAHVSGPMIAHQHIDRGSRYPLNILAMLQRVFLQKVVGQKQDIRLPLPQGRDKN